MISWCSNRWSKRGVRCLSLKFNYEFYHKNYISNILTWLGTLCLDNNWIRKCTHCNKLMNPSGIIISNCMRTIQSTPTVWYIVFADSRILATRCWDIPTHGYNPTRSFPGSGCLTWKFSLLLYWRWTLAPVWFGSSWKTCATGWVLG